MERGTFDVAEDSFSWDPENDGASLPPIYSAEISQLAEAIRGDGGVGLCLVEDGCGADRILSDLAALLNPDGPVARVSCPEAGLREILEQILAQLELTDADEAKGSVSDVLGLLRSAAQALREDEETLAVILEGADDLPSKTLVRLAQVLHDEECGDVPIRLFLSGRPELTRRMNAADDRSLLESVVQTARFDPVGAGEIVDYLVARAALCGRSLEDLFTDSALRRLVEQCDGRLEKACSLVTLAIEEARRRGVSAVTDASVDAVLRMIAAPDAPASRRRGEQADLFEFAGTVAPDEVEFEISDDDFSEEQSEPGIGHLLDGQAASAGVAQASSARGGGSMRLVLAGVAVVTSFFVVTMMRPGELPKPEPMDLAVDSPDIDLTASRVVTGNDGDGFGSVGEATPAATSRNLAAPARPVGAVGTVPIDFPNSAPQVAPAPGSASAQARVAVPARPVAAAKKATAPAQRVSSPVRPPAAPAPRVAERPKPAPAPRVAEASKAPAVKTPAPRVAVAPKAAPVQSPTPRTASIGAFTVQVGAFKSHQNAEAHLARVGGHYKDSRVVREKGLFRVLSGSFRTRDEAAARERSLKRAGFSSFVRTG